MAEELYLKTGGNPFFVTEALAAAEEEIPATVRDAVLGRAARLSPEARMLLDAIAVAGSQAELWLLDALAGDGAPYLEEALGVGHRGFADTGAWRFPMSWRGSPSRSRSQCSAGSPFTARRWRRWSHRPRVRRTPPGLPIMPTRRATRRPC